MIANLLIIKAKSLLNDLKSPLNILAHFLMTFVAVTYGFGYGKITNSAANGEIPNLNPDMFIGVLLAGILFMILTRMFLPTYTPQRQIFPKYYPLSKFQNYWASVVQDVTKPLYFYLTMFILVAFIFLKHQPLIFLVLSLNTLFSALFLRKIIQYPIDYILTKKGYILNLSTLAGMVVYIIALTKLSHQFLYSILVIPFALFYICYIIESEITAYKVQKSKVDKREMNIFIKLLMNCNNLRAPLLMSTVFKIVFLFYFIFITKNQGHNDAPVFFIFLFATPFALFANIFNNTWGFWKGVWINYELRTGSYKQMVGFTMRLVAIPLLVDIIISLPFFFYLTDDYLFITVFYTTAVISLLASSFLWSLLFPIAVQPMKAFQMKKNTSQWASFIVMIAMGLLTTLYYNKWAYLIIPIYLGGSIVALLLAFDYYKDKKYLLATTLLKD